MSARLAAALLVAVSVGCRPEGETSLGASGQSVASEQCHWTSAAAPGDVDVALCDLHFREIVRLEGSIDGIAPNRPVRVLREGTFVTGTYARGTFAFWGPDGELLDVAGRGPGEGPGEFGFARSFAQTPDGEVLVFTGLPLVHEYSPTGGFRRSFRLPALGMQSSDATHGGEVVVSVAADSSWHAFRMGVDSVVALGVRLGSGDAFSILAAAEGVGVWSANTDRYVFRRHEWPGGALMDSVVSMRDWFQGSGSGGESHLVGLQADSRGLIWAVANVPDPNARPRRRPVDVPIGDLEQSEARAIRDRDIMIEAFTPAGQLVASVRFDSFREAPTPMQDDLWYRRTPDELTVVILEAFLTERFDVPTGHGRQR
jgi:hypothetical protein